MQCVVVAFLDQSLAFLELYIYVKYCQNIRPMERACSSIKEIYRNTS